MRIIDTPLAVLRFQYRIVRFPLQIDRGARGRSHGFGSACAIVLRALTGIVGRGRGKRTGRLGGLQSVAVPSLSVAMRSVARPSSTQLRIRHDSSPVPT